MGKRARPNLHEPELTPNWINSSHTLVCIIYHYINKVLDGLRVALWLIHFPVQKCHILEWPTKWCVFNKPFVYQCVFITHAFRIPMLLEYRQQLWPVDKTFAFADEWRVLVIRFVSFVLFSSWVYTLGFLCFRFLAFGSYFTQVHLKKKGSFEQQQRCIFFNFPCVRLTRIRFLFFFLLRLYLWKKKFVAACVWFRVLFLLLLCSLVFFLLYTGAFQEERFIWTRKVHFFLLAMCYINTYSFSFFFPCFFLLRLYPWKKDLVSIS